MRKYRMIMFLGICMLFLMISGCSKKEISVCETTVVVGKDGSITSAVVESFDKEYYNSAGLEAMANEEINEFNQSEHVKETGKATLSKFEVADQVAKLYVKFDQAEGYAAFNQTDFFQGKVSEAYERGYSFDVSLKNAQGAQVIGKEELLEKGKNHILILEEPVCVSVPKEILFYSSNVELIDDKSARVSSESQGLAYILYK
ncbi:MAG: hypothetical protein GX567_00195 [Clostridia bacterium]|nr:hypothetical protein [Clostridia bacterium]